MLRAASFYVGGRRRLGEAADGRAENAVEGNMRKGRTDGGKGRSVQGKGFGRKSAVLCLIMVILTAGLNVAAWNSTVFCDWYIANLFPL